MENTKLAELLQTLDGFEWQALKRHLSSEAPPIKRLFRFLLKAHGSEKALERQPAFAAAYPDTEYDYQKLNNLMSKLLQIAEDWLTLRALEQNTAFWECHKAKVLLERRLPKHYRQASRNTLRELSGSRESTQTYYLHYQLAQLSELAFSMRNVREADNSLQLASDAFSRYTALQQLQYTCMMLERQRLVPADYQLPSVEPLLSHLRKQDLDNSPLLKLYYYLYLMLSKHKFHAFKQQYDALASLVRPEEQRRLLYFNINYCIGQIRVGKREFAQELLVFYQDGLNKKILSEDGKISPWTYKNIIKLGLNLGRHEWVEQFIHQYSEDLPEGQKKDALHYNLAELYFFRRRYGQALDQLRQVEFTDIHYNMGAKALLAKIYYEQGETEALSSLLSAFQVFLRRNRAVAGRVKEPYINFIRILSKTVRRLPENHPEIRREVEQAQLLNNRDWLLDILSG